MPVPMLGHAEIPDLVFIEAYSTTFVETFLAKSGKRNVRKH